MTDIWGYIAHREAGGITTEQAVKRLNEITANDPNGDASYVLRMMQIEFRDIGDLREWFNQNANVEDWELDLTFETCQEMFDLYGLIVRFDREAMTEMALADSLCPLHLIDYAICFDDEDPECRVIRTVHPNHDT